jgi:anti-sigma B factor antagonist
VKIDVKERKPRLYVITVEGEVDMSTSPDLREVLIPAVKNDAAHVVVDLSGVSYIDSSGIATLVEALKFSRKGEVRLTLAGARPSVEAVFELAYLKDIFEMVPRADQFWEGEQAE